MRRKAQRISPRWESYRREVIPGNTPEEQVRQSQRAFYAGVHFLLSDILDLLDPSEDQTEGDPYMIDDLQDELEAFAIDVWGGPH